MGEGRHRHPDDLRPQVLKPAGGQLDPLPHILRQPFAEEFFRQGNFDPPDVLPQLGGVGEFVHPDGGRVPAVVAGDAVHHHRRVGHIPGQRTDLVEGGGEGYKAVAGDGAVGGLHPDHPAEGRRLADGAAGVAAEGKGRFIRRHRRRRTARRAARHPARVPGVVGDLEKAVFGGGAHRELVHVQFPQGDGAGFLQLLDDVGTVGRDKLLEHPGGAGSGDPFGADVVLNPHRDAGEGGEGFSPGAAAVGFRRLSHCFLFQHREVGPDGRVVFPDGCEVGFHRLDGGQFARPEATA